MGRKFKTGKFKYGTPRVKVRASFDVTRELLDLLKLLGSGDKNAGLEVALRHLDGETSEHPLDRRSVQFSIRYEFANELHAAAERLQMTKTRLIEWAAKRAAVREYGKEGPDWEKWSREARAFLHNAHREMIDDANEAMLQKLMEQAKRHRAEG